MALILDLSFTCHTYKKFEFSSSAGSTGIGYAVVHVHRMILAGLEDITDHGSSSEIDLHDLYVL